jgi:hypothetical protein
MSKNKNNAIFFVTWALNLIAFGISHGPFLKSQYVISKFYGCRL